MDDQWYLSSECWRRHLLDDLLRHWLEHAPDRQHGGYVTDFDRRWQPTGTGEKTLVSQARLIYNFCCGYRHTGCDEFRLAAEHGLTFLRERFADATHGGWVWQCRRDGKVTDPRKDTYGHAFAIFALAEYARAFDCSDASSLARQTVAVLQDRMSDHQHGGLWTRAAGDWQPDTSGRSQNPHMHLLEALLSLHAVSADPAVLDLAVGICRLARQRFIHPQHGCLEEFFAADWSRLDDDQAAPVQVGHQFEWAWLLNRIADRGEDHGFRDLATTLMAWGSRHGWDQRHGGVFDQCDRRGRVLRDSKTFWVQSEALRALLYDSCRGVTTHRAALDSSGRFVWQHCIDHEQGGWFTTVGRDGQVINADKGSAWKVDYHMVSLCDEALRLLATDAA